MLEGRGGRGGRREEKMPAADLSQSLKNSEVAGAGKGGEKMYQFSRLLAAEAAAAG